MQVDFVRVPAQVEARCNGCAHYVHKYDDSLCNRVNGEIQVGRNTCHHGVVDTQSSSIWVAASSAPATKGKELVVIGASMGTGRSRLNDPATSKGKRKVNKYEQAVLGLLNCEPHGPQNAGLTGKEMAVYTGHPLNCITPRFAPLRRKGLIKDSGVRRDKQIVWLLC